MKARVLAAAGVAMALAATLSGCMTVHGETAIVPATSKAEAKKVLKDFVTVTNKANQAYDAKLNATIERDALGDIDQAGLKARHAITPEGDEEYQPLKLTSTQFHIPQQAGWPKFFVVDAASNKASEKRWMLVFARDSIDDKWKAAYLGLLNPDDVPDLAKDEDGYAKAVPNGGGADLLIAPDKLSKAYTTYLQDGKGSTFADGPQTTEWRERREKWANRPAARNEWADLPADSEQYPPMGLYTEDGDALVFFASHHHTKQTVAEGYTPKVDPLVEPLMKGEAKRSLTQMLMGQQVVSVPAADADEDQVGFLDRQSGVVSAEGE
ncbi:hypothetical protein [Streptomyces gobiensis]|uniref:hypothetical protein n=1 Tax=Streptomyces gobiensis TaxID=2875706 RepID=UPI001E60C53D|nr:hypothetical protein [Streptomyces gobiensis]UGY91077.1 hypothetical protein test1122_04625 [Streptomyces gobiensis]